MYMHNATQGYHVRDNKTRQLVYSSRSMERCIIAARDFASQGRDVSVWSKAAQHDVEDWQA